jgi:mannosyltransferase
MSWGNLFESVRMDGVNPPLYYIVVKALTTTIGMSELTLRLPSTLTNVLGVLFAAVIGYQVGGRIGSLASGWFWAFHPMTIWYARDARPYAMAAMFAAALVAVFIIFQRRNPFTVWVGVILIITLGLLTHYFFLVITTALLAFSIIDIKRNPNFFRRWTVAVLISFVPLTTWLYWFFTQPQPSLGIGWIQQPNLIDLPATLWNLLSGYGGLNSWPAMLFGGTVFLLVVTALIRGRERWSNLRTFIVGILLPVGATWLISQRRPVYLDRYFIVLLPMVLILVSSGAERLWLEIRRRIALRERGFILIVLVLCTGAIGLLSGLQVHTDGKYAKENWRELTQLLKQNSTDQTSILLSEPEAILPLTYYGMEGIDPIIIENTAVCDPDCWWILRRPYTATHAFSQVIRQPGRSWEPELPEGCSIIDRWNSSTGISLWHVHCRVAEGDGT